LESKKRSILKATTWRITATCTTTAIAFVITGNIESALTIGSIEFFLKFAIYYYHERLSTKIKFN
jgi:adenylylsulfate kinase